MVTSRAVVGSSAIKRDGLQESALAIKARWRMPPENAPGLNSLLFIVYPDSPFIYFYLFFASAFPLVFACLFSVLRGCRYLFSFVAHQISFLMEKVPHNGVTFNRQLIFRQEVQAQRRMLDSLHSQPFPARASYPRHPFR